jgi:hypothetical protein
VLLALPSLLQRLLANPLLHSLSLLQQLLLLLLVLFRLMAGTMRAGYVLMSPVLLACAKLLDSRCGGQPTNAAPGPVAQGASRILPAAVGVVGRAAAAAATEPSGINCGRKLKVLRRTGAGLRSVAVGGDGAGTAVPAGSLLQVLSKDASTAAGAAAGLLNAPTRLYGDTTGDRGRSCCCQNVCKLASVGVVSSKELPGLAVLLAALACALAAKSCRT